MIVLESNNPEESKIGWFAYVPKNRVNSENWKLVCEHLNNLEISKEDTMYLPLITISQISVLNGSHISRSEFKNKISSSASLDIQLTSFCVCGVD